MSVKGKSPTEKLIWAFKEYIYMLGEEMNELASFAYTHGWRSTRYEQGKKMREKILKLEEKLKSPQQERKIK